MSVQRLSAAGVAESAIWTIMQHEKLLFLLPAIWKQKTSLNKIINFGCPKMASSTTNNRLKQFHIIYKITSNINDSALARVNESGKTSFPAFLVYNRKTFVFWLCQFFRRSGKVFLGIIHDFDKHKKSTSNFSIYFRCLSLVLEECLMIFFDESIFVRRNHCNLVNWKIFSCVIFSFYE